MIIEDEMEIENQVVRLPLKFRFEVASSKKDFSENTFIRIPFADSIGWGEAAPSRFFGEDSATIKNFFAQAKNLIGDDPFAVAVIMDHLNSHFRGNFSAKAAINMALLDLMGKCTDKPVHQLFDIQKKEALVTSFTIGIDRPEVIKEKVAAASHMPILKVKLGKDNDYEIIETIRHITDKPLRVDANEGWNREEAVEKINWLEKQNVELVEQPLPAGELADMQWLRRRIHLPVFADESVKTGSDLKKLVSAFDGVNIKLMKCGGLTEAVKMARQANKLNLKTMLGCFIESSLAITAAAQIAPLFDVLDLDGALLLASDPFAGVTFNEGKMTLPDAPGLGVRQIGKIWNYLISEQKDVF